MSRIHRYMTHVVVLAIAMAIFSYSAMDRNFFPNFHAGPVPAAAAYEGVAVGDFSLGRDSVIIKPISVPTSPLVSRAPIVHIIGRDDTLESIGRQFNLSWREVLWSNPGLRMPLTVGRLIKLPPVPGVVVVVRTGDTPASLATKYGVDETILLGFNGLRGPQLTDPVGAGQFLCPIAGARIIQQFGPTSFAVEPPFGGYLHFHTGIDLLAGYGTPIVAAAGGKVTAAGDADYFGTRVEVTDSFGLVEVYAHMSLVNVALGQEVQQGKTIGFVGSTGLSVGSHLHFQLEVGGLPTAPGPLIGC